MQSFIACLTTLLLTSAAAFAGVLDPMARIESSSRPVGKSRSADSGIFRSMIIECSSPEGFEQLRDSGIVIYNTRGNMALACVPEHMISGLDSWPSLMRATMSRRLNVNLDKARGAAMVDPHTPQPGCRRLLPARAWSWDCQMLASTPGTSTSAGV